MLFTWRIQILKDSSKYVVSACRNYYRDNLKLSYSIAKKLEMIGLLF